MTKCTTGIRRASPQVPFSACPCDLVTFKCTKEIPSAFSCVLHPDSNESTYPLVFSLSRLPTCLAEPTLLALLYAAPSRMQRLCLPKTCEFNQLHFPEPLLCPLLVPHAEENKGIKDQKNRKEKKEKSRKSSDFLSSRILPIWP